MQMLAGLRTWPIGSSVNDDPDVLRLQEYPKKTDLYYSYSPEILLGYFCLIYNPKLNKFLILKSQDEKLHFGITGNVYLMDQINFEAKGMVNDDYAAVYHPLFLAAERTIESVIGLDSLFLDFALTKIMLRYENRFAVFVIKATTTKEVAVQILDNSTFVAHEWKGKEISEELDRFSGLSSKVLSVLF